MELLTAVGTPKLHGTLHPCKVVERVGLGEVLAPGEAPRQGVSTKDVRDAFFGFLEPPRISSEAVIRKAVARGVTEGLFAYTTGTPALGPDGKYQVSPSKVALSRTMSEDEVDMDNGFLMLPAAVSAAAAPTGRTPPGPTPPGPGPTPPGPGPIPPGPTLPGTKPAVRTTVRIRFAANRDEVFKSFQAIANLADKSDNGKISIIVDGQASAGYDANWLRNAVQEPLDEANIEGLQIE
jgi:hypothetical protein